MARRTFALSSAVALGATLATHAGSSGCACRAVPGTQVSFFGVFLLPASILFRLRARARGRGD